MQGMGKEKTHKERCLWGTRVPKIYLKKNYIQKNLEDVQWKSPSFKKKKKKYGTFVSGASKSKRLITFTPHKKGEEVSNLKLSKLSINLKF